jgi:hypothetical protein
MDPDMRRACQALLLPALVAVTTSVIASEPPVPVRNPFQQIDLPDAWEARFWADPGTRALLELDPKALADLVPVQAGVRFCRCPNCDAPEADDPLSWSVLKPDVVTCKRCGVSVPNDKYPAKDDKKIPEETVEVLPRMIHHYPYHAVEPEKQQYPDERLFLSAKRDYEARRFLSKAALYAAVRFHEQPVGARDPALARLVSVLLLRFAQVYPAYATHFDQPNSPKVFQPADLAPPYRRGYQTGKWEWTGCLDVPLNLVMAYALIRDDPALSQAGRLLDENEPGRVIERRLFRASAEFVRLQPEEFSELALQGYRGMLAVARLLDDPALMHEVLGRIDGFAERGFYHDGFWREGDASSHRRVVGLIDGWVERMLTGYADPPEFVPARGQRRLEALPGVASVPMLARARSAVAAVVTDRRADEVRQATWPAVTPRPMDRHPVLLGGVGLARLAIGEGDDGLDLELRGTGQFGSPHHQRQALRLAIAGRTVLGDLDELPPTDNGWDRATASHNTVVVDGLNQRESPARARETALGGDFTFFAADPDFQVVTLDDPRAYPQSTTRYRQTIVAVSGPRTRYALSVFEVHGGLQHDQLFHASAGSPARWQLSEPMGPGPATLLPPSIPYVATSKAADGRWFVQAYGEFRPLGQAQLARPALAALIGPDGRGVRLHLLNSMPLTAVTVLSPDPTAPGSHGAEFDNGRAGLILRRRSPDGGTLKSTFVTLFEPAGVPFKPLRASRVESGPETVVIHIETMDGPEELVVNLAPGTRQTVTLGGDRRLRTDGSVVRVVQGGLILAGGTFAETADRRVAHRAASGTITEAVRGSDATVPGYFLSAQPLPDASMLAGRALLIRHGDGAIRGWTLERVEHAIDGFRLVIREEPGFVIDRRTGTAHYYQFPRDSAPPPHRFNIPRISRLR